LQSDKPSLTLPEELRERLKEPFGRLIPDDQVDSFLQQLKQEGQVIVTVGDRTTRRCEEAGLEPILEIIDNKEKGKRHRIHFSPEERQS